MTITALATYHAAAINRGDGEWSIDEAFELVCRLTEDLRRISNHSLPREAEILWAAFAAAHYAAVKCRDQTTLKKSRRTKSTRTVKRSVAKTAASRLNERFAVAARKALTLHEWFEQAYAPRRRLLIYLDSCSAVLDGEVYTDFDIDSLSVLKVLAENAPRYVTGRDLHQQAIGGRYCEKTLQRAVNRLCPPFRGYVQGKSGQGRVLVLPPSAP